MLIFRIIFKLILNLLYKYRRQNILTSIEINRSIHHFIQIILNKQILKCVYDDDPYRRHILKIVPYVPLSQQNRFAFNEINEPLSLNIHAYGPFYNCNLTLLVLLSIYQQEIVFIRIRLNVNIHKVKPLILNNNTNCLNKYLQTCYSSLIQI